MPPLEYADHYQDMVYWEAAGVDDYGKTVVTSPIALKVRWETTYREVLTKEGARVTADMVIHTSRPLLVNSIVWRGKSGSLPAEPTDLFEVLFYEETPDLKNRWINRVVYCRRYADSLPTVI
jgi:hypothetical protein